MMSKIKPFLIDSQPEECDLEILIYLSLNVFIRKALMKKKMPV